MILVPVTQGYRNRYILSLYFLWNKQRSLILHIFCTTERCFYQFNKLFRELELLQHNVSCFLIRDPVLKTFKVCFLFHNQWYYTCLYSLDLTLKIEQKNHQFPFGTAVQSKRIADCYDDNSNDGYCSFVNENYNWMVDTYRWA